MQDRKREQATLMMKLGAFLKPLEEYASDPGSYHPPETARIFARACEERPQLINAMREFCDGESGHSYLGQYKTFHNEIHDFVENVQKSRNADEAQSVIRLIAPILRDAILEIPVDGVSGILEANSPFTAYCKLHDLCSTTLKTLVWIDRYFDSTLFHRYLAEVKPDVEITLVTFDPMKISSTKDQRRHEEFMDISKLFALERGTPFYRLVFHSDFHDRYLLCDHQLYALGGSVKDAGRNSAFTIATVDPSTANLAKVADLVSAGREVFGPGNATHP